MRLGEIKNIIEKVTDQEWHIAIDQTAIYGGQAYLVNNFQEFVEAYDVIDGLEWNDIDDSELDPIIEKYRNKPNPIQLEQAEFNILHAYVTSVNTKLPYFGSVLDEMVEDQDEKTINIKLPEKISDLENLSEINIRLKKTLELFNIDGDFNFVGFDIGTAWLIVMAEGVLTSTFFISCLKIAQEVLKTRAEYFKSEEARISLEACRKADKKITQTIFEKSWLEIFLENKIKETIDRIGQINNANKEETHTKLLMGTRKLIKELGAGTEFHLSLNPPAYATEINGGLTIDYVKIQEIRAEEEAKLEAEKPKTLPEPKIEVAKPKVVEIKNDQTAK